MCMGIMFMFAGTNSVSATDVWVAHFNEDNVDVYAMNDTITSSTNSNGRGFSIATKFVRYGQLQK